MLPPLVSGGAVASPDKTFKIREDGKGLQLLPVHISEAGDGDKAASLSGLAECVSADCRRSVLTSGNPCPAL